MLCVLRRGGGPRLDTLRGCGACVARPWFQNWLPGIPAKFSSVALDKLLYLSEPGHTRELMQGPGRLVPAPGCELGARVLVKALTAVCVWGEALPLSAVLPFSPMVVPTSR